MRTNVYVDGFNLYYGAVRNTPYRWLDIHKLCCLLFPKNKIHCIRYFTAPVRNTPDDPSKAQRQQTFIRALETLPNFSVHYGSFLASNVRMPLVKPTSTQRNALVVKMEEKGSDVNLASLLLVDAFRSDFEVAVVISNDSDLVLPIKIVTSIPTRSSRSSLRRWRRSKSRSAVAFSLRVSSRRRLPTPKA